MKSPRRLEDIMITKIDLQMKGCKDVDRYKMTLDRKAMANCVEMELKFLVLLNSRKISGN